MYPLEASIAGAKSNDKLEWSDSLSAAFTHAQRSLQDTHVITLPRPEDELWIITDAAVRQTGILFYTIIMLCGKEKDMWLASSVQN